MKRKGFTLIEVIIVIAIMGILMGIVVPSVRDRVRVNKEKERASHEVMLNKALRQYYALEGKYPKIESSLNEEEKGEKVVEVLGDKKYGPDIDSSKYKYKYKDDIKKLEVISK